MCEPIGDGVADRRAGEAGLERAPELSPGARSPATA